MNNINIYVQGEMLIRPMQEIAQSENFSCNFFVLKPGATFNPKSDNVFIVRKFPQKPIENVKYILTTPAPAELDARHLDLLFDIWPQPLTPALLGLFFRNLIIKLQAANHSEAIKYQKRLLEMAQQDYLTGLATRWYLHEYAEKKQNEQNLTCIYFDLDHFKSVNDTYGHQEGDRALAATGEMMQLEFPDGFCARMGGDEFMIVIPGSVSTQDIETRVNAFMKNLLNFYASVRTMRGLSVSAGISQKVDGEEKTIDQLIHESDTALYEAKKAGRACCKVYDSNMEKPHDEPQRVTNYYMIDYENVKNHGFNGIQNLNSHDEVCVFYSENAPGSFTVELIQQMKQTQAKTIYHKASVGTKNALDFQLAAFLGELMTENKGKNCNYFIVSEDRGYESLVSFGKDRKSNVKLIADLTGKKLSSPRTKRPVPELELDIEDLKKKIAELLSTNDESEISQIAEIIAQNETRSEINNALVKCMNGNTSKAGEIFRTLHPLIAHRKGGPAPKKS